MIFLFSSLSSAQIKQRLFFEDAANADANPVPKPNVRYESLVRENFWESLLAKGSVFAINYGEKSQLYLDPKLKTDSGCNFFGHEFAKGAVRSCCRGIDLNRESDESVKYNLSRCFNLHGRCHQHSCPRGFLTESSVEPLVAVPCPYVNMPMSYFMYNHDFVQRTAPEYYSTLFGGFRGTLIKFEEINQQEKWLKVNFNGTPMYMDISFCFRKDAPCEIWDLKVSMHEYQQLKFAKVRQEKSDKRLNMLIEKLLPCVKKRDEACVKSFFLKKEETSSWYKTDVDTYWWLGDKESITDEDYVELEACLRYESLLPHPYFLKGKNKACIFNYHYNLRKGLTSFGRHDKFMAISHPEAFSTGGIQYDYLPGMLGTRDY